MLHSVGIDRGRSGAREVSVNILSGSPVLGTATPVLGTYVSLPSSGLTFRRLFLPRASKAIRRQVMTEELGYSLPFPLAEAHYGAVESADEAWVVVAADSVVQPIRELYSKCQLEAEPLCYLRAAKAAGINHALVVDFGASKTVFCGIENGQVGTVRVMLRGGDALTEELAKELGLKRDEAELRKRDQGTELPTVRKFFNELVEEALLPSPLPYQRVLVCGGGSATPGLLKMLSQAWGNDVDVEPFPLPGQLMPTDHVVAFGAALAGRPKAVKLQMQHTFAQAAESAASASMLVPLVFCGILMGLMVFGLETRLAGVRAKEAELRGTLADAVKPILPEVGSEAEGELVRKLRGRLEEQRALIKSTPAILMNTLGQSANSVTSKKDAKLTAVVFEDQKLKLEGRAKDLPQSEDIKGSLEKVLQKVEQVKSRPVSGGFLFQIEGELPEP